MTKQELNRDVNRLLKMKATDEQGNKNEAFIKEFRRLYNADNNFEYHTLRSLKIMLRLNVRHQIIPFHQFGLFIDLENL